MGSLAELIVCFLDLLEAEGRALRAGTARLGLIVALLGVMGFLLAVGAGLIIWSAYLYLRAGLPPRSSALAVGLMVLFVTGVLAWGIKKAAQ